jgi:hypothetical protein
MSININPISISDFTENRPDPFEVFELRAWARALLYFSGKIDLHEAVDELQAAAERDGLVDAIGQDAVQEIIAANFGVPR